MSENASATMVSADVYAIAPGFRYNDSSPIDPLGDADLLAAAGAKRNFAKVGSARTSALVYTYGPGAIVDLPHFTVMPTGLDDWDRIWARRDSPPRPIHAPRLVDAARVWLGHQLAELRPHPWQAPTSTFSREGADLGIPAIVFPQWLRCTGCDKLAPLTHFDYTNRHPFRPDQAAFEHSGCHGRALNRAGGIPAQESSKKRARNRPAVPARYLLVCDNGHLDEFPYDLWVHRGRACAKAELAPLAMTDRGGGRGGATATIHCRSCGASRPMNEAQGALGQTKLPVCRGRHPHLDGFDDECGLPTRLMNVGASNLWFGFSLSVIVMPSDAREGEAAVLDGLRVQIGAAKLAKYLGKPDMLRDLAEGKVDLAAYSDVEVEALAAKALAPDQTEDERAKEQASWDPVRLLRPEWDYLQIDPAKVGHEDQLSGLTLTRHAVTPEHGLPQAVTRVLAVERLRKVNALLGFTRVDDLERTGNSALRLAPISRRKPSWTVATEDRGEGVFLQLDSTRVSSWEERVLGSDVWAAHVAANRRNVANRQSASAVVVDPDLRLRPPRYWLLHTLAHALIREMAMYAGYGAASLAERIYAWPGEDAAVGAAGLLITTTAADSEGTLGGLVRLSQPSLLSGLLAGALTKATRCSSDPLCGNQIPRDPQDFLHGAGCHCCVFASETSCERSNRFLDRRFLVPLPGFTDLAFFEAPDRR